MPLSLEIFLALTFVKFSIGQDVPVGSFYDIKEDHINCSFLVDYIGRHIHLAQNQIYVDLQQFSFIPTDIKVKYGCMLTWEDDEGKTFQVGSNAPTCRQGCLRPVSRGCCECFGCYGATTPNNPSSCAIVYDRPHCSVCMGLTKELQNGEQIAGLEFLNDKISSIMVRPGCQLEIYKDSYYQGEGAVAFGMINSLDMSWDNTISSLRCSCENSGNQNPTPTPILPVLTTPSPPKPSTTTTVTLTTTTLKAEELVVPTTSSTFPETTTPIISTPVIITSTSTMTTAATVGISTPTSTVPTSTTESTTTPSIPSTTTEAASAMTVTATTLAPETTSWEQPNY